LKDPAEAQFPFDAAREELEGVLGSINIIKPSGIYDGDGDVPI